MNFQHIRVLAGYELIQSFRSARGILFLVIYGVLWFWFLWKLAEGWAVELSKPEANWLVSMLFDAKLARVLFVEHPPTLGMFYLLALGLIPIFTMWGAGDQTATDIGTRHLRFLIPRCGRGEIFVGRFIGAFAFMGIVHLALAGIGMMIAMAVDAQTGEVITYGIRVILAMFIYTLPYVALMAFCGALTGSAAVAILTAISAYAVVGISTSVLSIKMENADWIGYVFPSALKQPLLTGNTGEFTIAMLAIGVYTVVYLALGWQVFRRRDI